MTALSVRLASIITEPGQWCSGTMLRAQSRRAQQSALSSSTCPRCDVATHSGSRLKRLPTVQRTLHPLCWCVVATHAGCDPCLVHRKRRNDSASYDARGDPPFSQRGSMVQSLTRQVSENFVKLEQDRLLVLDLKKQLESEKPETVRWLRSFIGFSCRCLLYVSLWRSTSARPFSRATRAISTRQLLKPRIRVERTLFPSVLS